jgi:hypothetical protein
LFEVAVLFIASHFIAIGTLIFEWGSGGFLSGIAWVLGIFFFYWLSLMAARYAMRIRFGGTWDDPLSLLGFGILPILNYALIVNHDPGNQSIDFVGFVLMLCCWFELFPTKNSYFLRNPDAGLGVDPLKRENKREQGRW